MKKLLSLTSLIIVLSLVLAACTPAAAPTTAPAAEQKVEETAGPEQNAQAPKASPDRAFAYDPTKTVNDGKAITIKFWNWTGYEEMYKSWAKDYQKIHPNVTIEYSVTPWGDYWKKLPLAITSGQGPDVFAMHNQQTSMIIDGNLAHPYPDEWIPMLKNDFDFVDSHLINGQLYYMDSGVMTSMIMYNKKMWAEAGLTDQDIPTTWDELTAVAKKMTKTDDSGKMLQEGFGINGYAAYAVDMLAYQLGSYMYQDGGRKINVDDAHKQALQRVIDWYDTDKVSSRDFPSNNDSFAQGKTAMIYMWGWFNGYLKANNPDIEFGMFKLPTWTGKVPPAYDRNNGESTFVVSSKAPDANKAVALDFIHYVIDNEDYARELVLSSSQAPVMKRLKNDPDLLADPAVAVTMSVLDRTLWPGAFSTGWDPIKAKTIVDGIKVNMPIDQILALYEEENNKDLEKYETVYWAQERSYKYASEMMK